MADCVRPTRSSRDDTELDRELLHSWRWFQYHADQRLRAFHFFLLITAILAVAYAQAVQHGWEPFGVVIGLAGAVVAAAFWALDVRNTELVLAGHSALLSVEADLQSKPATRSEERSHLGRALSEKWIGNWLAKRVESAATEKKRSRLESNFTHRSWFRRIEALAGLTFGTGAIWAGFGFPGT